MSRREFIAYRPSTQGMDSMLVHQSERAAGRDVTADRAERFIPTATEGKTLPTTIRKPPLSARLPWSAPVRTLADKFDGEALRPSISLHPFRPCSFRRARATLAGH